MKFISFFITLILISILNNFVLSSGTTVSDVTLIVNLNNNNSYPVNGSCGSSTQLTCNNINDAINYFNTIAVNVNRSSSQIIYQQLNLLLDDGNYSTTATTTTINLYQFNITISPLNPSSNKVIINGLNSNSSMFSVTPFNGIVDSKGQNSYILITGIQFLNFKQSIIQVSTNYSFTDIRFESCIIDQYNSNNSMIEINKLISQDLILPNSHLKINNSQISNIQIVNNASLIYAINTIIGIFQTSVINATNVQSIIEISYGQNLDVEYSDFSNVNSVYGIFNVLNTQVSIGDGNFNNNIATNGASVLTFTSNVTSVYNAGVARCNFNENSGTDGGVFQGVNTDSSLEDYSSSITSCTFSGSSANNGGAIFVDNIPLSIVNCQFSDVTANVAGAFVYNSNNHFAMTNVTYTEKSLNTTKTKTATTSGIEEYAIYISSSSGSIQNATFDDNSYSIFCNTSTVKIDATSKVSTFTCAQCNMVLGQNQICSVGGSSVSSSTSASGSSLSVSSSGAQSLTVTSTSSTPQTSGTGSSSSTSSSTGSSTSSNSHTIITTTTTGVSNQLSPSFSILIFIILLSLLLIQSF
ncbi:hypothetical protein DDB_G0268846 [Dictyostelium discoideum AX4]|uniref:Uncharacterized protein n=1 Tax=Dictyostelium discoideum TaxID=44689 RepID=Q55EK7_DICDI|nr:hypothetical protein DDB_G0268846 [Dictyostelium discoideum AX4]EAL73012.1 hypothetical protein DDB_G0268846 [Dictyostelium discoideum AX4]|eukprot:XP_647013.1 hypothetical protein DDB_G0268846 [Dictyostelium discoideum AX4]